MNRRNMPRKDLPKIPNNQTNFQDKPKSLLDTYFQSQKDIQSLTSKPWAAEANTTQTPKNFRIPLKQSKPIGNIERSSDFNADNEGHATVSNYSNNRNNPRWESSKKSKLNNRDRDSVFEEVRHRNEPRLRSPPRKNVYVRKDHVSPKRYAPSSTSVRVISPSRDTENIVVEFQTHGKRNNFTDNRDLDEDIPPPPRMRDRKDVFENRNRKHLSPRRDLRPRMDSFSPGRDLHGNRSPRRFDLRRRCESPRQFDSPRRYDSSRPFDSPGRFDRTRRFNSPPRCDSPPRRDSPRRFDSPPRRDSPRRFDSPPRRDSPRRFDSPPRRDSPRRLDLKGDQFWIDKRGNLSPQREDNFSPRIEEFENYTSSDLQHNISPQHENSDSDHFYSQDESLSPSNDMGRLSASPETDTAIRKPRKRVSRPERKEKKVRLMKLNYFRVKLEEKYLYSKPVQLNISDISQKGGKISNENFQYLITKLENIMLHHLVEKMYPKFFGYKHMEGILILMCANNYSSDLIKNELARQPLWPGANLKCSVKSYIEVFVTIILPPTIHHFSEFLQLCQISDARLHTMKWRCVSKEPGPTGYGQLFMIGMDLYSYKIIKAEDGFVRYGNTKVKVFLKKQDKQSAEDDYDWGSIPIPKGRPRRPNYKALRGKLKTILKDRKNKMN